VLQDAADGFRGALSRGAEIETQTKNRTKSPESLPCTGVDGTDAGNNSEAWTVGVAAQWFKREQCGRAGAQRSRRCNGKCASAFTVASGCRNNLDLTRNRLNEHGPRLSVARFEQRRGALTGQ
jgi:hypothetical protein